MTTDSNHTNKNHDWDTSPRKVSDTCLTGATISVSGSQSKTSALTAAGNAAGGAKAVNSLKKAMKDSEDAKPLVAQVRKPLEPNNSSREKIRPISGNRR